MYQRSESDMYLWLKRERKRLIVYHIHKSESDMYLWLTREREILIMYHRSQSDMYLSLIHI